ncbi:YybH family protein [Montanilutibacter psychrotolerans]|uniref:YybH family protein n=1 Tax=Montanilutibacter psychrotolerans TaxID=1327343 RepID=UPI001CC21A5A|nr:nuclear transport factor 2 family protein [Lysobacter psychrotolerans]
MLIGSALAMSLSAALAAEAPPPAPQVVLSADECAVWTRELGFARSVAENDATAFAEHLHADATFGASQPEPTRGRDAVAKRWARIVEGKRGKLSWYPTRVTIAGNAGAVGEIAWSSGPSLYEDLTEGADPRYAIGAFHSVWVHDADGVWRVLFDDGVEQVRASEADVAAFHAGRRETCPSG